MSSIGSFLDIPYPECEFGTERLMPKDGKATIYWPYQIGQNIGFLLGETTLLHSFQAVHGMKSPYNFYVFLPEGTYTFMWSLLSRGGVTGTISGTFNGERVLYVRKVESDEEGYTEDPVVYHATYPGLIVAAEGWYLVTYNITNFNGDMDLSMYRNFGPTSRWSMNDLPGAVGQG